MSRGHGVRQRQVLDDLKRPFVLGAWADDPERQWVTLYELAGVDPTASDLEATRRAIHRLVDERIAETRGQYVYRPGRGGRRELACRLVLGEPLRRHLKPVGAESEVR